MGGHPVDNGRGKVLSERRRRKKKLVVCENGFRVKKLGADNVKDGGHIDKVEEDAEEQQGSHVHLVRRRRDEKGRRWEK